MTKKRGGGNCGPMMGGKRRKSRGRTRKMRGGNFYGVGAPITPGAIEYTAVENNGPAPGGEIPAGDIAPGTMTGASRRRRGRKSRGRKMRGGASQISAVKANAGFVAPPFPSTGPGGYVDVGSGKGGNAF